MRRLTRAVARADPTPLPVTATRPGCWGFRVRRLEPLPTAWIFAVLASLATTACTALGPTTIPRDQFDYGHALSSAQNEQLLLNIVRVRYLEAPMFVEVSSIINQYAWVGEGTLASTWGDIDADSAAVAGRFEDRPTITYTPVVGREFTESLLTPVPPGALLFLVQSGWPLDFVFRTCLQAINGHFNRGGSRIHGRIRPDPGFDELIETMTRVQGSGAIGMRVVGVGREQAAAFIFHRHLVDQVERDRNRVRELLRVDPEADVLTVTYGADSSSDTEIAMLTRSLFEIMTELSHQVLVPPDHVAQGRAAPPVWGEEAEPLRLITIHGGERAPDSAFVTVDYKGQQFWIDDADLRSKRTFAFVSILFNLTKTGPSGAGPLVTVGN